MCDQISAERCWVDGKVRCSYGCPSGQFVLRPTAFCSNACATYRDNMPEPYLPKELKDDAICEHFAAHSVRIAAAIRHESDGLPDSAFEDKEALDRAANLLERYRRNIEIIVEDDLPK